MKSENILPWTIQSSQLVYIDQFILADKVLDKAPSSMEVKSIISYLVSSLAY